MTTGSPRRRVLLVEDETIIAMMMEEMLADLGYVAETAAQIQPARLAAENGAFDLAILDLNLGGDATYPIAEILQSRRIPFVFSTGYDSAGLEPRFAEAPRLQKPFEYEDLRAVMSRLFPA